MAQGETAGDTDAAVGIHKRSVFRTHNFPSGIEVDSSTKNAFADPAVVVVFTIYDFAAVCVLPPYAQSDTTNPQI